MIDILRLFKDRVDENVSRVVFIKFYFCRGRKDGLPMYSPDNGWHKVEL
jgi:hypothetical protein